MNKIKVGQLIIRQAKQADLKDYVDIQKVEWKNLAVAKEQAKSRFNHNLGGILVAGYDNRAVGSITTMRIDSYNAANPESWYQVTNNGLCDNHQPRGKVCFGVDLSVATDRAPSGTVDALFVGCMALVIEMGVKYFMLGGRMPQYHLHAHQMEPGEYLYKKQANGHYLDKQVDMYSRVPLMKIVGLAPNYFKDPQSLDYGVILRWRNPFYGLPFKKLWADFACWLFAIYLDRQRRAYQKRLEKMPL